MRLTPVLANSFISGPYTFESGKWRDVPATELDRFLSRYAPVVLEEERGVGLFHIRYTGTKRRDVGHGIRAVPGMDYCLPRHMAYTLLRRGDFDLTPIADVMEVAERILIIRNGSLGDVLLALPSVLEFRRRYPEVRMEFQTEGRYKRLVEDFVDAAWSIEETYEQEPYDAVFDLRMVCEMAKGSRSRVDTFADWFGFELADYTVPYEVRDDERKAAFALMGVAAEPAETVNRRWRAETEEGVSGGSSAKPEPPRGGGLGRLGELMGGGTIIVQAKAAVPHRSLSGRRLGELLRALVERGHRPVACCSDRDDALDDENIVNLTGRLDIPTLMACIELSDAVVAPDSGILHCANVFEKPTVGLFGSVAADLRVKSHPNCRTLQANDWHGCPICNEHQLRECKRGVRCLDAIPIDAIMTTLEGVLGR